MAVSLRGRPYGGLPGRIEINYKGKGRWFKGKIVAVNLHDDTAHDGAPSLNVTLDDGDYQDGVALANVRPRRTVERAIAMATNMAAALTPRG